MLISHGSTRVTNHSLLLKHITYSWQQGIYIFFEILKQEFDTVLDFTFQEGPNLNLHNIYINQIKFGFCILETYHTMKRIIQMYRVKRQNMQ